ncbi:helix-turn-helix domain-containing protein [Massilia sp. TSP1-1-2]|uniref:helix-turn-helix domain-containing protein n=1 Tax=unclassified Massilia TaxID=2609279 RepID=UPI003CED787A
MEGKTNWEISKRVGCSASTIKTHLQHIYAKLGVTGRAKAAALWACRAAAPRRPGLRHADGASLASLITRPGLP